MHQSFQPVRQKLAKRDSVFDMQTVREKFFCFYPCVVGRAGSHTVRPTPSSTPSTKGTLMQWPTGVATLTTAAVDGNTTPTTAAFEGQ